MKFKIQILSVLAFSLAIIFTSCKKDTSTSTPDYSTELSAQSDDQSQVSAEIDAVADDANVAISSEASISGRVLDAICDATVEVSADTDPKTITITYNGTNCHGNRTRTGKIVLSMAKASHWKDAGAVVTISVQNLKVTRLRDGKSITINGTKTITNVSGGLITDLATAGTIIHDISSDGITITFDNGSQRSWKIAEHRIFTYDNGIVVTATGTHTEGAVTGIAIWGINRFGNAFTCAIAAPIVIRQDCDFRVVSGQIVHTGPVVTSTTTFGLNADGNATSCPGTGSYYFKIVWVGVGGNSHTIIWPY